MCIEEAEKANKLVEWYWDVGYRRCNMERQHRRPYKLDADWLNKLYRRRRKLNALRERAESGRFQLGVWGLSQAGKSTMLASELDNREALLNEEDFVSAIQWSKDDPITWGDWDNWLQNQLDDENATTKADPMNPYNNGADATAIPTRFTMRDKDELDYSEAPCEVKLASLQSILAQLYYGYEYMCEPAEGNGYTHQVEDQLTPKHREAFELMEAVETLKGSLDHLYNMAAQAERGDNPMDHLRKEKLKDVFPCPVDAAKKWVKTVLWNSADELDYVFDQVYGVYRALNGYDRILTDHTTAARLLKFNLDGGDGGININAYSRTDDDDSTTLGLFQDNVTGENWSPVGFGLNNVGVHFLQTVIREISMPLRKKFVEKYNKKLHDVLEVTDIIDFPGIKKIPKPAMNVDGGNGNGDRWDTKKQAKVLKAGKTATVTLDYVQWNALDAFCIVQPGPQAISNDAAPVIKNALQQWKDNARTVQQEDDDSPTPLWWVSTRFENQRDQCDTFIPKNIGAIFPNTTDARHFAAQYPMYEDMWDTNIGEDTLQNQMNDIVNQLQDSGLNFTDKGEQSFQNIQLHPLEPGDKIKSVQLLWKDMKEVLDNLNPGQNGENESALQDLLEKKSVYPGVDEQEHNDQRREDLNSLKNGLLEADRKKGGRFDTLRRFFYVPEMSQGEISDNSGRIFPDADNPHTFPKQLAKNLCAKLLKKWEDQAESVLEDLNIDDNAVTAVRESFENNRQQYNSFIDFFRQLLPKTQPHDMYQIKEVGQLMAIRLADSLSGGQEPFVSNGERVKERFNTLSDRDVGERPALPGDDQLLALDVPEND